MLFSLLPLLAVVEGIFDTTITADAKLAVVNLGVCSTLVASKQIAMGCAERSLSLLSPLLRS